MKFSALNIFIGELKIGIMLKYGGLIRLQFDVDYANIPDRPLLSLSMRAADPAQEAALLMDSIAPMFNSTGDGRLPNFFQNLLPEGILRKHIAAERACEENDYFELFAACGEDLPGNVRALPATLTRAFISKIVTQDFDALEESVIAEPLEDGVSISGMQPKLALILSGGRYVSGLRHGGGHIIGKLPTTQFDLLPEVEHLSLRLAEAAGVTACETSLQPLSLIIADHQYVLGKSDNFLAVKRFDRDKPGRLHAEDFAQILGVDPQDKYTGGSYADIARIMLAVDGLGENAVLELIRRIAVSELLGNYDFHLKNIGILHFPDGHIALSPAYDIVAYGIYLKGQGHALSFAAGQPKRQILSPASLRAFANDAGIAEPKLKRQIANVVAAAADTWPRMIEQSTLMPEQKERLQTFINERPVMQSVLSRRSKVHASVRNK